MCGPWKMTKECLFYENMYLAIIRAEHNLSFVYKSLFGMPNALLRTFLRRKYSILVEY